MRNQGRLTLRSTPTDDGIPWLAAGWRQSAAAAAAAMHNTESVRMNHFFRRHANSPLARQDNAVDYGYVLYICRQTPAYTSIPMEKSAGRRCSSSAAGRRSQRQHSLVLLLSAAASLRERKKMKRARPAREDERTCERAVIAWSRTFYCTTWTQRSIGYGTADKLGHNPTSASPQHSKLRHSTAEVKTKKRT